MSAYTIYRDLYFSTFTILNWKNLLIPKENKQIILESFSFLNRKNRVRIYAFVVMSNHIHVLWEILDPFTIDSVVHSFKSYTANELSKSLNDKQRKEFEVNKKDRQFQYWKKSSLSVELQSPRFVKQKLNYIHDNPLRSGIVSDNMDYEYCSYKSYYIGEVEFEFLTLLAV